jgi:hypothetical protein
MNKEKQEKKMKLKNLLLLMLVICLSGVLVACGSAANPSNSVNGTSTTNGAQSGTSLSKVNMLLVGTLKLDGTSNEVTAEQAAQLLPLWQAYRALSNSQTAAEAEVESLLNQIESTMTPDQVKAIQDMNLTSTDMADLMQSMGGFGPQGTPDPKATPGANFQQGGMMFQGGGPPEGFSSSGNGNSSGSGSRPNPPAGGMVIQAGPGGGDAGSAAGLSGAPMTQGTQDPSMQATAQARFSTQASQVNPMLLNVLISKLEAKTGGNQPTATPTQ